MLVSLMSHNNLIPYVGNSLSCKVWIQDFGFFKYEQSEYSKKIPGRVLKDTFKIQ